MLRLSSVLVVVCLGCSSDGGGEEEKASTDSASTSVSTQSGTSTGTSTGTPTGSTTVALPAVGDLYVIDGTCDLWSPETRGLCDSLAGRLEHDFAYFAVDEIGADTIHLLPLTFADGELKRVAALERSIAFAIDGAVFSLAEESAENLVESAVVPLFDLRASGRFAGTDVVELTVGFTVDTARVSEAFMLEPDAYCRALGVDGVDCGVGDCPTCVRIEVGPTTATLANGPVPLLDKPEVVDICTCATAAHGSTGWAGLVLAGLLCWRRRAVTA